MRRLMWLVPVLAIACSPLWLKPGDAQLANPAYDGDGNKLIDRKLGKINPGDPQWLVDGKFYDVGRNPQPKPGKGGPPSWQEPIDWGDLRFRVSHIKFDYTADVGADDKPGEGLELQYKKGSGSGNELEHIRDDRIKGEWVYKWADDPAAGRNEPALYACKETVKIKVRIECSDRIASAEIGAKQVGQRPGWLDVERTRVEFIETPPGSGRYVSKGPVDPVTGPTEYVEMNLLGNVRDDINKTRCTWQWYVDGTSAAGNPPGTPVYARDVCENNMDGWEINLSEGYEVVTHDDGTTTETAVPHTFYTVLGKPTNPYYREHGNGLTTAFPWVTALEFAIITPVGLAGVTNGDVATTRIANFCYKDYALKYDHAQGTSSWVTGTGHIGFSTCYTFQFNSFISKGRPPSQANCLDQACAVATLSDLVAGSDSDVQWLPEFGYVKATKFVGGIESNNPLWDNAGFVSDKIVPSDDTCWRTDSSGKTKRSVFWFHVWCKFDGNIFDATVGDGAAATKEGSSSTYRTKLCDVSNSGVAGMNWRDDERVARFRHADGYQTEPATPWLQDGYRDTAYTIETDSEGFAAEHANMARMKRKDLNLE